MRARERFSPRDWGRIPEAGAELPRRTAPPACCGAYVAHLRRKAGGFSLVVRTLSTWVSHYWSHCNPAIRINCDLDQSMPTKRKSERYWNLYISGLNSSGHRRHRLAGCNLAAQLVEKRADVREGSLAGGLGLPIIGRLLGHAQAATTARYAHLDNDPLRRASEAIAGRISAAMDSNGRRSV